MRCALLRVTGPMCRKTHTTCRPTCHHHSPRLLSAGQGWAQLHHLHSGNLLQRWQRGGALPTMRPLPGGNRTSPLGSSLDGCIAAGRLGRPARTHGAWHARALGVRRDPSQHGSAVLQPCLLTRTPSYCPLPAPTICLRSINWIPGCLAGWVSHASIWHGHIAAARAATRRQSLHDPLIGKPRELQRQST